MKMEKYIYWQAMSDVARVPRRISDYWTQGETEEELRGNLIDIYRELTSGMIAQEFPSVAADPLCVIMAIKRSMTLIKEQAK